MEEVLQVRWMKPQAVQGPAHTTVVQLSQRVTNAVSLLGQYLNKLPHTKVGKDHT